MQTKIREIKLKDDLNGINGWLLIVAFGIIITPFRMLYYAVPDYYGLVADGTWAAISSTSSDSFSLVWTLFISVEVLINLLMLLCWLYIGYLFFTLKPSFPAWYIFIMIFTGVFLLVDAAVSKILLPEEPIFDLVGLKEFLKHLFGIVIWVPYMLVSKRVKITFGKQDI